MAFVISTKNGFFGAFAGEGADFVAAEGEAAQFEAEPDVEPVVNRLLTMAGIEYCLHYEAPA